MKTHTVNVQIVRFTRSDFPGWVECVLRDAANRDWILADKVPIFTNLPLNALSTYPQPGAVACEIVRQWADHDGRTRCIINTERPWGVSAGDGKTQFEVFMDQVAAVAM
jgi:hypothetical protein